MIAFYYYLYYKHEVNSIIKLKDVCYMNKIIFLLLLMDIMNIILQFNKEQQVNLYQNKYFLS
jgi:hypothetical protein